jgi:hypothetical protein
MNRQKFLWLVGAAGAAAVIGGQLSSSSFAADRRLLMAGRDPFDEPYYRFLRPRKDAS